MRTLLGLLLYAVALLCSGDAQLAILPLLLVPAGLAAATAAAVPAAATVAGAGVGLGAAAAAGGLAAGVGGGLVAGGLTGASMAAKALPAAATTVNPAALSVPATGATQYGAGAMTAASVPGYSGGGGLSGMLGNAKASVGKWSDALQKIQKHPLTQRMGGGARESAAPPMQGAPYQPWRAPAPRQFLGLQAFMPGGLRSSERYGAYL